MQTWIVLLRGIGGKYTLPSKTFLEILDSINARDARTYIASGNAVFRSRSRQREQLAKRIRAGVQAARGFSPEVLLLTPGEIDAAIAANPYRKAEANPPTLHLVFLSSSPPDPDLARMESLASNGEEFTLRERVLYFHAPGGMARSRLAGRIEKLLGVWTTARNWRTSCRLSELARETTN